MDADRSTETLYGVQVLRAVAALSVATLHAQHEARLYAVATGRAFAPAMFLPWQAGVDIFFVVSGFVMVHASGPLFRRPRAWRTFLARRVARVVPLYWLTTAAFLGLAVVAPTLLNSAELSPAYVVASFLFIPMSRQDGLVQPLYGLGWTLNYEMFFYGLFAVALRWSRHVAVPGLALALLGFVLLGQAASLPQPLAFWCNPVVLEFAAGAGLGLLRAHGSTVPSPARAALALAALAAFVLAGGAERDGFARVLFWGAPAACLVAACGLGRPGPRRRESVPIRLAVILGDASYALYLIHPFAIRGTRELVRAFGLAPILPPWGFVLLGLALAAGVACLLHRLVERPLTGWLRGVLGERRLRSACPPVRVDGA